MRGSKSINVALIWLLVSSSLFGSTGFFISSARAGSSWIENATDFNGGTKQNISIDIEGISLEINNSLLNNWTKIKEGDPKRNSGEMIYDNVNNNVILFGGKKSGVRMSETWGYDLKTNTWVNKNPSIKPQKRDLHRMAYDSESREVVLFGGYDTTQMDDTWTYNLSTNTWTNKNPASHPSAREGHAMAYDNINDVIVLFSGWFNTDTWTYNLNTNTWINKNPASSPPVRSNTAMVYDSLRGEMVLFGGIYWDGSYSYLADTWTYNVTTNTWINKNPSTSPPAMNYHGMVFDSKRGEVFLFGGQGDGTNYKEVWTYNLSLNTWKKKNPAIMPPWSERQMVYDSANDEVILLYFNQTWVYNHTAFVEEGSYISQSHDTNGSAYFGTLQWNMDKPPNTSIKMQFRSADTKSGLNSKSFVGPDGTATSYFTNSGQQINDIHNGSRWIQYKAYLTTQNVINTPLLKEVQVKYNLIHNLSLLSPVGNENWTGTHDITWNASDPDGDNLKFNILLESNTSTIVLAENLNTDSWEWNTDTVQNGTYRIRVIAKDDNITMPLSVNQTSGWFAIHHPKPNTIPKVILLNPKDNAIIYNSSVQLKWLGEDDDNDTLTYYVFFDETNATDLVSHQTETIYNLTGLEDNKTYFWTVIPNDGKMNGSKPSVRMFTINLTSANTTNKLPVITSNPNTTARVGTEFSYDVEAFDPDIGDILTYSLDLTLENMTINSLNGIIKWTPSEEQIGNNDVRVNVTDGRDFVTQSFIINVSRDGGPINNIPRIISIPIKNATMGSVYRYDVDAVDDDALDVLSYSLEGPPTGMKMDTKTGLITWTPLIGDVGNYTIIVKVTDGKDDITQTFSLMVALPIDNHNPRITNEPSKTKIQVNKEFRYEVKATDEDGDTLTFSLSQGPEGMIINSSTGLLVWTPNKEDLGDNQVTVNVTDNKGGYAEKSFTIFVIKKAEPSPSAIDSPYSLLLIVIIIIIIISTVIAIVYIKTKLRVKAKIPVVIDDIFLIYKDGRLISHHTRKLKPDMDDEILGGMFTAVQEFIKTSFGSGEEEGEEEAIDEISYGKRKILIEHGKHIFISAVVSGEGTKEMHKNMNAAVHNIETEFDLVLEKWSGETKELKKAKKWVKMLISSENIQPITVAHGKRERLDQFNIETERKPDDEEIDMSGKRT